MKFLALRLDVTPMVKQVNATKEAAAAATRPAAQAGAQIYYDQVKLNVAALGRVTGNLDASIYQAYSAANSGADHATYHVSWNATKAPHGGLVENGHLQRYRYFQDEHGRVQIMIRPEKRGLPRPSRRASQAEKDAYYVPLPTPIQVPAKAFVRRAASRSGDALSAMEKRFFAELSERGITK